jgi:multidrug resistance efflux pump
VKKDLQGKRQQISSLMLRLGRIYPGKTTWGPAHMKWLMAQELEHREQRIAFEELLTPGRRARRAFGKRHPRGGARVVARRGCRGPAGCACTVRAYVVTMAPEVAGRIIKLSVADNQFVHKGDDLFEIDPADYQIALERAEAQAQRDGAALDYARANENRKASLAKEGWASTDIYQQTTSTLHQSEGIVALDKAAVAKAQLDLSRTAIRSPANGYVTNLLAQLGDYATVGQKLISVVDTDSFWVDGYFEETSLGRIHEGNPATVKLMGYNQPVHGHVGGIARGINVSNAQPDQAGLASVNPIFTWVRLAQRVPVRIHVDQVPDGVRLVAGMTATVQIDPQLKASKR